MQKDIRRAERPARWCNQPDTAVRLARYFGTSEQFWMGLQDDYELEEAHAALGSRLDAEVKRLRA